MNTQTTVRLRFGRTLVFLSSCMLAGPVAAAGIHNTSAKICQGATGGAWAVASVGGIATPPTFPVTRTSFNSIAYGANIALKFCPPVINAPPTAKKDPDSSSTGHECYATFHQSKTADYYSNLYGASLWNKRNLDWGDLGKPYVYDFNTGAYVRVVDPARRMDVDNVFKTHHFIHIPDSYSPGDIQLPIGYNRVQWRADANISSADIALPIILLYVFPAGNEDAEKAIVKSTPEVEEEGAKLAEKVVEGSAGNGTASKLVPKWLTKNLAEAARDEAIGQATNPLNWLATQVGHQDLFNGFRSGLFFPRRDLVSLGIAVNTDEQEVWVYDNDPPTLASNTDPNTFPDDLKPLVSYDPNTGTYYVEATGPGLADASVAQMAKYLLIAHDVCQGNRRALDPLRLSGAGIAPTPAIWHPGDLGSFQWQVQDSGPNHNGQPNLSNVVTQKFGVRDTHPPILIAPPSKVVEIDPGTSTTIALGAPRYFDLADYTPEVSNSLGADSITVTQPGINTIDWTATDNSGNSSTQEQLINVKLTGTNTAPMANDQSVNAVSYEPVDIVLTGYDADVDPNSGRHDPLSFTIKDKPIHGHFIAPLLPYFIDDYRLGKQSLKFANDPQQSDPTGFCTSQSTSYTGQWQMQYPYNASWITVNDDGSTVVYDQGNIICFDSGIDSANAQRLAMFDVNGNLVNSTPIGDIFVNSVYMDWITKGIYVAFNTDPGTGNIAYYDKNFTKLGNIDTTQTPNQFANPVAITADHQGIVYIANNNQIAAFQGPTSEATLSTYINYKFLGMIADYTDPVPTVTGTIKSMATDTQNNLYVSMDNRVLKYSASSISIDPTTQAVSFTKGAFIGWMGACDSNLTNTTYACDTVKHVSLGFACKDSLCGNNGGVTTGALPGQFNDTRGLAVDPHDILYVSDYNNSRIQRFTADGAFAGLAKSSGAGYGFILGDFGNPENITVNSDHLYILNKYLLHSLKTTPVTPIDDTSARVTYQSDNNFVGTDNFSFEVTDGLASDLGNVALNITRNYRPPEVSVPPSYTLDEDGSVNVTLVGTDPDGSLDVLSYTIFTQPKHGTLSGTGADLVYTPDPYYYGTDSFSYQVSDGMYSSAPATVTLTVNPVPHAPQVSAPATQAEGLGFNFYFPVEVFDPDQDEALLVSVDWGDGSSDRSGVLVDQNGVPVAAGDVIQSDGSVMAGLESSSGGPVVALNTNGKANPSFHHAYASSGDHVATICVTDQMQTNPDATQQPSAASHPPVCTTTTFSVSLQADLLMSISAAPGHAAPGDRTQFTLSVTNRPFDVTVTEVAQGAAASNIMISGHGSNLLTTTSVTGSQGHCSVANGQFNCSLGTLAYGSSASISLRDTISPLAPGNARLSLFANRTATAVAALDSEISGYVSIDPSGYAPHLFRLGSSHGSTNGGDVITITGRNFDALARVDFGTYAATAVSVLDSTHITLTTPAQPAGVVDVVVTNSDGQSSTLTGAFRYLDPQTASGSGGCSISDADDGVFDPSFFVMLFVAAAYLLRRRRDHAG